MRVYCREQAVREQQNIASPLQPRRPHVAKPLAQAPAPVPVPTYESAEPQALLRPEDILELESDLISAHRNHIETHMKLVRLEMTMLSQVWLHDSVTLQTCK